MSTAPQTIPRLRLSLSVLLCGSIRPVFVCNGLRASLAAVCIRVFSSAPAFITPRSLTLFFSYLLLFHLLPPDFQREFQDCFTMMFVSQILKTCRQNRCVSSHAKHQLRQANMISSYIFLINDIFSDMCAEFLTAGLQDFISLCLHSRFIWRDE